MTYFIEKPFSFILTIAEKNLDQYQIQNLQKIFVFDKTIKARKVYV